MYFNLSEEVESVLQIQNICTFATSHSLCVAFSTPVVCFYQWQEETLIWKDFIPLIPLTFSNQNPCTDTTITLTTVFDLNEILQHLSVKHICVLLQLTTLSGLFFFIAQSGFLRWSNGQFLGCIAAKIWFQRSHLICTHTDRVIKTAKHYTTVHRR